MSLLLCFDQHSVDLLQVTLVDVLFSQLNSLRQSQRQGAMLHKRALIGTVLRTVLHSQIFPGSRRLLEKVIFTTRRIVVSYSRRPPENLQLLNSKATLGQDKLLVFIHPSQSILCVGGFHIDQAAASHISEIRFGSLSFTHTLHFTAPDDVSLSPTRTVLNYPEPLVTFLLLLPVFYHTLSQSTLPFKDILLVTPQDTPQASTSVHHGTPIQRQYRTVSHRFITPSTT